jgi:hypothetical protein
MGSARVGDRRPEPRQLVLRPDPVTGIRLVLDARVTGASSSGPAECDVANVHGGVPPVNSASNSVAVLGSPFTMPASVQVLSGPMTSSL